MRHNLCLFSACARAHVRMAKSLHHLVDSSAIQESFKIQKEVLISANLPFKNPVSVGSVSVQLVLIHDPGQRPTDCRRSYQSVMNRVLKKGKQKYRALKNV